MTIEAAAQRFARRPIIHSAAVTPTRIRLVPAQVTFGFQGTFAFRGKTPDALARDPHWIAMRPESQMAKKTLAEIHQQIDKLQQEAEAMKAKEKGGVVARIREAIVQYELTPQDLFGKAVSAKATRKSAKPSSKDKTTKSTAAIKYRDEAGNAWVGMGKRPAWFNAALAAGKTVEDLLVK